MQAEPVEEKKTSKINFLPPKIAEEAPKEINRKFFSNEIKLFGQYEYNTDVKDISLTELIAINTAKSNIYVPHTAGRYQVKRFRKTTCPIVERLTNSLMYHGRNNGKKCRAITIVKQALDIIALVTNKNPLETILSAVSIAGPREDSTRIGAGGAVKKTAVDVSPLRRINMGIYLITVGAREASFRNSRNIAECLADELIACASVYIILIKILI
jgi:small subunit ribosomal protein S5e